MDARRGAWERGGRQALSWIDAHRPLTAALFAFGVVGILFFYLYLLTLSGEFRLAFALERLPFFVQGLQLTMTLTAGSFVVGIALGFLTATARVSRFRAARAVAKGFVDVFRGTPIFVQIFLWFTVILAVIPTYQYRTVVAGLMALTINTGAYQGEIFRGGMKAIQEGQLEAGRALGFTSWQLTRHIKLPQTLRLIIPPMTNEFILLLKASALLSAINVVELAFTAQACTVRYFLPIECWTNTTLLYLAVTVPLAKLVQYMETRFRIPGLGLPTTRPIVRKMAPPAPATVRAASAIHARRENGLYASLRRWMEARAGEEGSPTRARDQAGSTRGRRTTPG